MRASFALLIALLPPSLAFGQAPDAAARKKETLKWVLDLQDPNGGFYPVPKEPGSDAVPQPSLRATSSAVRAIKYLGGELPHKQKHAAFVLNCFDAKSGGFAEPGGKPDVAITSVGVMAAMELGIPKDNFAKAMDYLKENARTFEEVRIGAAAVEAWGVKECPFKLDGWEKIANKFLEQTSAHEKTSLDFFQHGARDRGSWSAFMLRLGLSDKSIPAVGAALIRGQWKDGGWGKRGEMSSDIESTYRVMRALMLLKEKPNDPTALRKFIDSHRNTDGGYATKPGEKSSVSGVYYAAILTKWLDAME